MYEFEKEKTILEIDAQHNLTYIGIIAVSFISLLLTIWLTEQTVAYSFQLKMLASLGLSLPFLLGLIKNYISLKKIKVDIRRL